MIYLSILRYFELKIFPVDNSGICALGHVSYRESKKYTGEVNEESKVGWQIETSCKLENF